MSHHDLTCQWNNCPVLDFAGLASFFCIKEEEAMLRREFTQENRMEKFEEVYGRWKAG